MSSLSKEGKQNALKNKSSFVTTLLNDDLRDLNIRTEQKLRGIKPKNHHKQNLKNIKTLQKIYKDKDDEKQPIKYTSKKFKNIKPKVIINKDNNITKKDKQKVNFVKQNISKIRCNTTNSNSTKTKIKRKPAVPKFSQLNTSTNSTKSVDKSIDFIKENRKKACEKKILKEIKNEKNYLDKRNYGKVPEYLVERKKEFEIEKERIKQENEKKKIPKGMRLMGENERLNTLNVLEIKKNGILENIKRLPLRVETMKMKKYEKHLRDTLSEIEKSIDIFSKKIVYVKLDE